MTIIEDGDVYVIEGHGPLHVAAEAHAIFDSSFMAFCESRDGHWDGEAPISIRKASKRELETFAKACNGSSADADWVLFKP